MLALVVDDNQVNLAVYLRILEQIEDVTTQTFTSSAAAFAWCATNLPDIVLLDYRMPAPDGVTFIRDFRATHPDPEVPILMITADKDRDVLHRALDSGASDFLTKPADPVEFVARVRNLVELRRRGKKLSNHARWLTSEVMKATQTIAQREQETINRLMRAAEYRDNDTGNHIVRMGHYAAVLGKGLGLDEAEQRLLLLAAPMHDIGKVSTPDAILLKPGPLTPEEWASMRQHPTAGHALLDGSESKVMQLAATIALGHHEKWDGSGYPSGIRGTDIPLAARICAIGDVFDALISKRPYKEAWPIERAIHQVHAGAGTHFDPKIVAVFERCNAEMNEIAKRYEDATP